MVVVEAEGGGVHGLVKGPGVAGVLLGQHVLQQPAAVAQRRAQLAAARRLQLDGVRQVLLGGLDGPAAAHPAGCGGRIHHHGLEQDGPAAGAPHQAQGGDGSVHAHAPEGGEGERGGVVDLAPMPALPQAHHAGAGRQPRRETHGGGGGGVRLPLHTLLLQRTQRGDN